MSDEAADAIIAARMQWMADHRAAYLRTGGAEGHVMDLTEIGGRPFTTHCLIRYTGRKSGRTLITPLIYGDIGGEVVIVASKGGADEHPAWYLNIRDGDHVEFQIATQAFRGTWREPAGDERAKVWDFVATNYPPYADYQASTAREIPLVMMKAAEPIAVFREADAD